MGCGGSKAAPKADPRAGSQPKPAPAKSDAPAGGQPTLKLQRSFSAPLEREGGPAVTERKDYDQKMRAHLVSKATPSTMAAGIKAVTLFKARAQLAKSVVQERSGDTTTVAAPDGLARSPTSREREQAAALAGMNREERMVEGMRLLQERVDFIRVKVLHMEDDGNCQFRALAYELHGSQNMHLYVRQRVIAHLKQNADEYSFFVGDEGDWKRYLDKMAASRCWGDELTLRAASDAYGVAVHVVTTEKENWLLHYGEGNEESRQCFLTYISPIHYNVVVPLAEGEASSHGVY